MNIKAVFASKFNHWDIPLFQTLKKVTNLKIVDVISDVEELIARYSGYQARTIFIHVYMGLMSGFEAARFIREQDKDINIVMVSEKFNFDFLNTAMELNLNGYISADTEESIIQETIQEVQDKGSGFGPVITSKINKEYAHYFLAEN
jgi:DNA-binding NarL/FixJ family response regulator